MKRSRIILLSILGVLVVAVVAGLLVVDSYLTKKAHEEAATLSQQLGRKVEIGSVATKIITGLGVRVSDVSVGPGPGEDLPLVQVPRIEVKAALLQAIRTRGKEVTIRSAEVEGLHYDFEPKDDPIYYAAPDRLALAADTQPKVPPSKEFEYTDINPILTAAVLSAAAGMPIQDYAEERLFKPLGMRNYAWGRADKKGLVSTGWGLRLRPVDMAKIGLLVLHHGRWQGRQLVPAGWIDQMTSPGVVPYFGDYWWINDIVTSEP